MLVRCLVFNHNLDNSLVSFLLVQIKFDFTSELTLTAQEKGGRERGLQYETEGEKEGRASPCKFIIIKVISKLEGL